MYILFQKRIDKYILYEICIIYYFIFYPVASIRLFWIRFHILFINIHRSCSVRMCTCYISFIFEIICLLKTPIYCNVACVAQQLISSCESKILQNLIGRKHFNKNNQMLSHQHPLPLANWQQRRCTSQNLLSNQPNKLTKGNPFCFGIHTSEIIGQD